MKPIPSIPENESLTDLLDLVSSSDKFKERVQQLKDLQDVINKDLGDRSRIAKLDGLTQLAASKLAEASRVKSDADAYGKSERDRADAYVAKEFEYLNKSKAEIEARFRLVAGREHKMAELEASLALAQTTLAENQKEAAALMVQAKNLMDEAVKKQSQYETKLSQLKQLAG